MISCKHSWDLFPVFLVKRNVTRLFSTSYWSDIMTSYYAVVMWLRLMISLSTLWRSLLTFTWFYWILLDFMETKLCIINKDCRSWCVNIIPGRLLTNLCLLFPYFPWYQNIQRVHDTIAVLHKIISKKSCFQTFWFFGIIYFMKWCSVM